jgi:hypothetical protein
MTRQDDDAFNRLERVLAEAHQLRSEPVLGPEFARDVMRDIHAPFPVTNGAVERSVWQVALVAAGFAAVFTATALWYAGTEEGAGATLVAEEFDEVSGLGD